MMKVLMAMSGGVDSSVAAKLLCDEGYECIGCTMKLYDNCDAGLPRGRTCCSLDDVEDARSVAFSLGMRYYVFNFKDDFHEKVIKKFASGYLRGQTPNPCIDCNRYMKFDKLFERAKLLGCDKIATGHYARIEFDGRKYRLKKALDKSKDQSYVLYMLTQEQLAHTLFPLGSLHKTDTRAIADTAGLSSAHKPDSQDICFVPDGDYAAAIERLAGIKAPCGNFIDASGKDAEGKLRYHKDKNQNKLEQCHIDDIFRAYTDRVDVERFAHVASLEEIKANEFNLNIPRYVDTFEEEELIDIEAVQGNIERIKAEIAVVEAQMAQYLKELGL